eukprot:TRINITY_DN65_c0_g3_i1.p1 TRINITY_DN65_c0_g3~~TRINITY_DN65_c0_g3_i1.p1  ORF type:complete len:416 (+),score=78.26 TRINITY_DN65_c0_g3_i1:157-1404(+)
MYTRWGRAYNHTTFDIEPLDDDGNYGFATELNASDPRGEARRGYADSYTGYPHRGATPPRAGMGSPMRASSSGRDVVSADSGGSFDRFSMTAGEPTIDELDTLLQEMTHPTNLRTKANDRRPPLPRQEFQDHQERPPSWEGRPNGALNGSGHFGGHVSYSSFGKPPTPQYRVPGGMGSLSEKPQTPVMALSESNHSGQAFSPSPGCNAAYPPPSPPVGARPLSPVQRYDRMVSAWNTSRPSSSSSTYRTRQAAGMAHCTLMLPDDVIMYILSFLWPVRELFNARLACQGFKLLTDTLRLDCNICFQPAKWKDVLVCDTCYDFCCRSCAGLATMPKVFIGKPRRLERYKHLPLLVKPRQMPLPWVPHPCGHSMHYRRTCSACTLACSRCRGVACEMCIWCDGSRMTCYSCSVTYGR